MIVPEKQVIVPEQGMFWVATREEAEALAMCLAQTGAWVTVREAFEAAPNGFKWCVYFKEPYGCKGAKE